MSAVTKKVIVKKLKSDPAVETAALKKIQEFYDLEDDAARRVGHDGLKKKFLEHSAQLRRTLEPIVAGESTEALPASVLVQVATMRRLSRLSQYASAQLKKENFAQLEKVEAKYLELQNANSEIEHLQKEVKRCLQFSAGDEDLDMVTEEEFYANAPESVSEPEKTKNNDHAKHLAKLAWELEQRKQLMSALNDQENLRSVLVSDIEGKEQRLRSLKPKIAALIKAAKPVQDLLGVQPSASTSSEQRALMGVLPHDLCVLYVQAEAYRDIMQDNGVHVSIVGDVEDAQKWMERKEEQIQLDSDEEGPVAQPAAEPMDTSSSSPAPRRKRTVSARLRCVKENLIDPHPVYVTIDVDCEDDVQVGLRFRHFPEIRTTVLRYRMLRGFLPSEHLICNADTMFDELYSKDYGNFCPDQVGNAKLKHCKITVDTFARDYGRPYQFVQAMTGSGDSELGGVQLADRLQQCVKLIRKRVVTRIELAEHIHLLESLRLSSFQTDSYPSKNATEMLSFENISEDDYLASLSSGIETNHSGFFYRASFHHKPTDTKVKAVVAIPAGYPRETPLFSLRVSKEDDDLTAENDDLVKLLEAFVNNVCLSGKNRPTEAKSLLAHQILSLATRCDVLCDLHPDLNGGEVRNSAMYETSEGQLLPLQFCTEMNKFI